MNDWPGDEYLDSVEGWVSPDIIAALPAIGNFQRSHGIRGGALEIGVHHGKFFIPLHEVVGEGETSFAVDLFEAQYLNIDHSGHGSLEAFKRNLAKWSSNPAAVRIVSADSLSWSGAEVGDQRPRIASIDGGHTVQHTTSDLRLVERLLAPGGLIIVDDYTNLHWPGVSEGVARHFMLGCPRTAPVFCAWNKLILADFSWHAKYLALFETNYRAHYGYKEVSMFGCQVAVIQ